MLKTLAAIASFSLDFLTEVGCQLSAATSDVHEAGFLFQCICVAVQQCNAVVILESFVISDVEPHLYPFQRVFLPRCMEYRRGLAMRILSVRLSVHLSNA